MIGAYYDPESRTSYFFTIGEHSEYEIKRFIDDIEQAITHETIHYLIHKIAGEKATIQFDKINEKVFLWDFQTYHLLY